MHRFSPKRERPATASPEAHEVCDLTRIQVGPLDSELVHAACHHRHVVPHVGREPIKAPGLGWSLRIKAHLAAQSGDRMALDAALRSEDARARERTRREFEGNLL
jgi:hypothetical protein